MSESTLEQRTAIAAAEARDEMANLGIKGSTVKIKTEVKAEITLKLPDILTYRRNSRRIHDKEVELMTKYPDVTFDFDIQFTK
jgi:hypothetical protein